MRVGAGVAAGRSWAQFERPSAPGGLLIELSAWSLTPVVAETRSAPFGYAGLTM